MPTIEFLAKPIAIKSKRPRKYDYYEGIFDKEKKIWACNPLNTATFSEAKAKCKGVMFRTYLNTRCVAGVFLSKWKAEQMLDSPKYRQSFS